jgi:hypothetical protein
MDERRIGALEPAAETDRAQFFGVGIAPKRARDAAAEPDAMRVAGGLTGRIGASSHLAPVRRGACRAGWATSRVRRGVVVSGTALCRTPLGKGLAARSDALTLEKLGGDVLWKCFPGANSSSAPGAGEESCRRRGYVADGLHRTSAFRAFAGEASNAISGLPARVSRLARGTIILRDYDRLRKRQSATYGVPRLHTTDRVVAGPNRPRDLMVRCLIVAAWAPFAANDRYHATTNFETPRAL